MAELTMPKNGHLMEEGTIIAWKFKVGDAIKRGDKVADVEADKGIFEVESPYGGTLKEILVRQQQTVAVGTPIAVIE